MQSVIGCVYQYIVLVKGCHKYKVCVNCLVLPQKCSKSLSPPTMARMSPFSQTVDSRSWSTFYSEELSFGLNFEPLLPQLCLHPLWTSDAE